MKLVVSGAREGYSQQHIDNMLDAYLDVAKPLVVIEGCAPGVDNQVHQWAARRGATERFGRHWDWDLEFVGESGPLVIAHFPAQWKLHGGCRCNPDKDRCNYAGHRRNLEMLAVRPDEMIGFHSNIRASKGTQHCIRAASHRKIRVTLIGSQLTDIPGWPLDRLEADEFG